MGPGSLDVGFRVERLNGSNYPNWKFKLRMVLMREDLWSIVQGEEVVVEDDAASLASRVKRDNKALSTICLMVDDNQLIHVRNAKTSAEAWSALKMHYEKPTLTNKLLLRKKLLNYKLEKGADMQAHITAVINTADELRSTGEEVTDETIVTTLLSSLHDGFDGLITALESKDDATLTLEYVKSRLLHEHQRMDRNKVESSESAMKASKFNNKKSHSEEKREKNQRKCFYCDKVGHYKRDCLKRKADQQRQNKESSSDSSSASAKFSQAYCFSASSASLANNCWFIDSGCSNHMSSNREWFSDLVPVSVDISVADDRKVKAVAKGKVRFQVCDENDIKTIELSDALYVPELQASLFSVGKAASRGFNVEFMSESCIISKNNEVIIQARKSNGLYRLEVFRESSFYCSGSVTETNFDLWHRRLGHANEEYVKKAIESSFGVKSTHWKINSCEPCIMGKMHRQQFPKLSESSTSEVLELIHSDVCGPMKTESLSKKRFILTFIDDYSRFVFNYFIRTKDEVPNKFKEFEKLVTVQTGHRIKCLRSDNGSEYSSNSFLKYLRDKGIKIQRTAPYTPEQNGIAERCNRSIIEMARTMLNESRLKRHFWAEAVNTAVYIKNRLPSRVLEGSTPYQRWYKNKPNLDHFKVFGSIAYCHVPKEKRTKLDYKAEKCLMLGYDVNAKAYRLLNLKSNKIIVSRDVVFNEDNFVDSSSLHRSDEELIKSSAIQSDNVLVSTCDNNCHDGSSDSPGSSGSASDKQLNQLVSDTGFDEESDASDDEIQQYVGSPTGNSDVDNSTVNVHVDSSDEQIEQSSAGNIRISTRCNKGVPPIRFDASSYLASEASFPNNWNEAVNSSESESWLQAAKSEYKSLMDNKTWSLVKLPNGKRSIGTKWVFTRKLDDNGKTGRFKARLVAKGYSQVPGIDYVDTFAPVAKFSTFRTLLTVSASLDMEMVQMDVSTAFLNGNIDEELFIDQPEGFVEKGKETFVCKLNKSIYGLRQSPRQWYKKLESVLVADGFSKSRSDGCLFTKILDGKKIFILTYVDDILISASDQASLLSAKQVLNREFEMKDLGVPSLFLGIHIERCRDKRSIFIDQRNYIESFLNKYNMADSKAVATPMAIDKVSDDEPYDGSFPYRECVGSLMYAMVATRPDIAAAVGVLCRTLDKPTKNNVVQIKRLLRYLNGSKGYKLKLGSDGSDLVLEGFVDSDWAGDAKDRKSTSGYLFFLKQSLLSWLSRKQTTVALSTTEAEYVAATSAAQEAMWLRNLLVDFGIQQVGATIIYEDNQGAIKLASNSKNYTRVKHISIKYHFIKDLIENGMIKLVYCCTERMLADVMTKALTAHRFKSIICNLINTC